MDAALQDTGSHDATMTDARTDTSSSDVTVDSPADVIEEPTDDASNDGSMLDASGDAPVDGPVDAPMDSPITIDGGKKGCLGVFCIKGLMCCNNPASVFYGMCIKGTC